MALRVVPTIPGVEREKEERQNYGASPLLVKWNGAYWLARKGDWQEVAVRDFEETADATEWMLGLIGGSIAGIVATVGVGVLAQLGIAPVLWFVAAAVGAATVAAIIWAASIRFRLRHVVAASPESERVYWRLNESLTLRELDDAGDPRSTGSES